MSSVNDQSDSRLPADTGVLQRLAQRTGANLLMCGSDISLDVVLLKFRESWARPLHVCGLPGPLVLPASATTALLLRDVAALTRRQQQTLLDWIDAAVAKAQIISATSQDLFAAVVSRSFSERLYYRLNVLVAEL